MGGGGRGVGAAGGLGRRVVDRLASAAWLLAAVVARWGAERRDLGGGLSCLPESCRLASSLEAPADTPPLSVTLVIGGGGGRGGGGGGFKGGRKGRGGGGGKFGF